MNLEKLNLVELNAQESMSVGGGELPFSGSGQSQYDPSPLIKDCVKATLGFMAGLRDGLMSCF